TNNIQWVAKEHHMMHPIQRLMNTAKAAGIRYEVDGQLAPLNVAIAADQRLRQHIEYDSGLRIWVNWDGQAWEVEGRTLPQWGVLALGPDTHVETALWDGKFADYAECPEFIFCDARTSFNMPYLNAAKDIEPKLQSFEWLGGNRIRVVYTWTVNDTLDKDYRCYVHFTSPLIGTIDNIAFQQDHNVPKPTSQWTIGETIVDGPYDITLPDGPLAEYAIKIGLYKDVRVPLEGTQSTNNSIMLGRLFVERAGDTITNIRLGDPAAAPGEDLPEQADFTAHMNPANTWIDFGKIATDGSVKININERELLVFPYPREKEFTVAVDIAAIVDADGPASSEAVRIDALAAETQENLGAVPFTASNERITFRVGLPGAGRYRVHW
ncbi:MAG: hypothetical protein KJ052_04395, partial [Candidatus Hydrogenedentes bacterium]|nr:hypothetical protein [Candidatus Hydrogenedentota bacterium]